jgi:hypothetical protein
VFLGPYTCDFHHTCATPLQPQSEVSKTSSQPTSGPNLDFCAHYNQDAIRTRHLNHSWNKIIFVLDFYYTELDVRALEEAFDSIERPRLAIAMITSTRSTRCSISDSTLTQTTTASNNQIIGFWTISRGVPIPSSTRGSWMPYR